jgi:hypothetical protein
MVDHDSDRSISPDTSHDKLDSVQSDIDKTLATVSNPENGRTSMGITRVVHPDIGNGVVFRDSGIRRNSDKVGPQEAKTYRQEWAATSHR